MSATTQGFMRTVSEHLLLERIGSLETRLSQLEKLIKKLQKTTASEASPEAEASTPADDPNAWAFSASGRQQGPEAWVKRP
ncbi:MAG: hypothetical protein MK447_05780 [SAR324 cluster bacterium]|nr:hypothetical protein [SAR324 cluster bacterium]